MSRQFRVYLLPSDIEALCERIDNDLGMKILKETSMTADSIELSSPVQSRSIRLGSPTATSVRCYLTPSSGAHIDMRFYDNLDYWILQPSSEAIEFSGCDFDGDVLLMGRFYFQTDFLCDESLLPKREEFTKWANSLFRSAKKVLRRSFELDAYVGNDADAFRKQGGKFASLIRADGEPAYEPNLGSG